MRALIYDHELSDHPDLEYYVSINYLDKNFCGITVRDSRKYISLNEFSGTREIFLQATRDLCNFSNKIGNNMSVKELISFQDISLWWFYEIPLRINYTNYLKYKEKLNDLFADNDIIYVLYNVSDSILSNAIVDCCAERGIAHEEQPSKKRWLSPIEPYFEYMRYGLNFVSDLIISRFYNRGITAEIVIASYTKYWTRFNITKDAFKDGIFEDIQREFDASNVKYIGIEYNDETLTNYIKTRFYKHKYARGKWIPLNAFATPRSLADAIGIYKDICRNAACLSFDRSNEKFIFKLLKNHIATSLFLISDILSMKNAISSIRPGAVLTSCEYCKMGRAATVVCNQAGIPSIALQHGILTPVHWGYIFCKPEEVSFVDATNSRPLPRYTLLYGKSYKKLLTNSSNYPENSLIVTGQPRYDHLYKIADSMDKNKFLADHKLKSPLIVWTSQGDLSEPETRENIASFLSILKSFPQISLFIKPHPNENDLSIYEPLTGCRNVTLSREIDLYKLLNVCSIMITKNSTTAMEAAALDRPVIVLNLSGEPDIVDYVEEGIALGVYRSEDLVPAVRALLKDDSTQKANRAKYIERYLYKIDGNSSRRVANFVQKVCHASCEEMRKPS